MKLFLIVLILSLVAVTFSISIEDQWKEYKTKFVRIYNSVEDQERFEIFKKNLQEIEEHNAKYERGEVTYTKGINQFTDRKREEYTTLLGGLRNPRI